MNTDMPIEEFDTNIVSLIDALNEFEAIETTGSCGGHADPGPGQHPEGSWFVLFKIEQSRLGWVTLEFLAWLINHDWRRGDGKAMLIPTSYPPYLNTPGRALSFLLEGAGEPNDLAAFVTAIRDQEFQRTVILAEARAKYLD